MGIDFAKRLSKHFVRDESVGCGEHFVSDKSVGVVRMEGGGWRVEGGGCKVRGAG